MNVYEIIFSPTGGTQKVSHTIAGKFQLEIHTVDLADRNMDFSNIAICKEDLCVLAVPSYGGRVPQVAVSRLLKIKGNGAKVILVAVYGNREFEDTLIELQEAAITAGFSPIAAISAIAEHSIARQFAAGRPDAEDCKELEGFAEEISSKLLSNPILPPALPGKRPYKIYNGSTAKPTAGPLCTRCGLCAAKCPVGAISPGNPAQTDADACISCMRCVSLCPMHARALDAPVLNAITNRLNAVCTQRKPNRLYL